MRYLLLLSLYSVSSFASPTLIVPECPVESLYNINFNPPEMARQFSTVAKIQPALDANFKFNFGTNPDGSPYNCSGTYTSNSGHFSTALHCLRMCLLQTGHLQSTGGLTKVVRTTKSYPATCEVQTPAGTMQMNVWASGECYAVKKEDCSGEHDFIFGQIVGVKTKCAKIRTSPPKLEETVVSVSTPSEKTKGRLRNPDGKRPHFDVGQVLDPYSTSCDEVTIINGKEKVVRRPNKEWVGGMGSGRFEENVRKRLIGLERMSADATFASSGGSVIDANGDVIGIITNGTSNEERECRGASYFNPVAPIMNKLRSQLSPQQFRDLTNCP